MVPGPMTRCRLGRPGTLTCGCREVGGKRESCRGLRGLTNMMYVNLFGVTTVLSEDQPAAITEFGGGKPREILEILAVAGGAPVAKDRLAELLWDGAPPKSWVATLESYISVLRRRLGCAPGRQSELATTSNGYRLDLTRVQVDVVRFRTLAAEAARLPVRDSLCLVDEALALASRELLASEPTADWAQRERDAFRSDLVRLAGHGATAALEVGDFDAAGRYATFMTQHDAIDEVGWQQLMVARWRAGRRSDALRAYAELRTVLADELGVEPSAQSCTWRSCATSPPRATSRGSSGSRSRC